MSAPLVSVVIPHYRSPRSLALVLTALELQDHPMDRLEVVVADDGSPEAPDPGDRPYDVRVVRQEDLGFRGAAARNLGARASQGPVLLFLDQDTVPEPSYVRLMAAALTGSVLAVGHRRHADLDGWEPSQVRAGSRARARHPASWRSRAGCWTPMPAATTCVRPTTAPTAS